MKQWESYEEVAAYLLGEIATEFGVDFFEGKQQVAGTISGTKWQIDAKGVRTSDGGFMIVECKRWPKKRAPQETMAGLAFRIIDTGAIGGIFVGTLAPQEGASKVAASQNIIEVQLNEFSTRHDFEMHFLNKFKIGASMKLHVSGSD